MDDDYLYPVGFERIRPYQKIQRSQRSKWAIGEYYRSVKNGHQRLKVAPRKVFPTLWTYDKYIPVI